MVSTVNLFLTLVFIFAFEVCLCVKDLDLFFSLDDKTEDLTEYINLLRFVIFFRVL